jgi:putative transposase
LYYKVEPCKIAHMSNREKLAPGSFYHVYNRGTEKRKIFLVEKDYSRFLASLFLCNSKNPADLKLQGSTLYELLSNNRGETLVDICAYCLMPNHFHLLLHEKTEGGISKFMQKLQTAYTMY